MSRKPVSSHIPAISISADPEKDVNRFVFFLESRVYRRKRPQILNFYPKLTEQIQHGLNEQEAVREVVTDMYRRYGTKIEEIIIAVQKEIAGSEPVFAALAKCMECPQLSKRSYSAVPTFLPFSPLDENLFYFSIARTIAGQDMKPWRVVATAIHEVSHFIFYEQLDDWSKKNSITLNDPAIHYFKEALAAAIMDQPEFRTFFDYQALYRSDRYFGNAELHQLSIGNAENNTASENIIAFFEKEIVRSPDGYAVKLDCMLRWFAEAGAAFAEKWNLWNNMPINPAEQDEAMKKYREPIILGNHVDQ